MKLKYTVIFLLIIAVIAMYITGTTTWCETMKYIIMGGIAGVFAGIIYSYIYYKKRK